MMNREGESAKGENFLNLTSGMDRSVANDEAQRWLGTAEKLLAARDLFGAKSFAIRVREAFPRLESAADEVVAVADTLIAGENRIGGSATGNHHHHHQNHQQQQGLPDWYGVMSLPQFTQNVEAVANQYHRLAIILNPHRNRLPYADEAFRLATDAWSVLSNPSKKVFYDNQLAMYSRFDIAAGNQTQAESQSQTQSHNHHHHQLQEHQFLQRSNNLQPHHHQPPPQQQQQQHPHHFYHQNPSPPPQQPQFQPSAQPFQPPRHQPQHQPLHQHQQYQHQQLQQQQTPNARRKSPRKGVALTVEEERPNLNNAADSSRSARPAAPSPSPSPSPLPPPPLPRAAAEPAAAEKEQTPQQERPSPEEPSFWTACPFCYILYEYPKLLEDYVLRCQNCKRAFTAGAVPAPPISDDGTYYFCCWGFFPLGYSSKTDNGGGSGSGWTPFSPIFACPLQDEGNKKKGHQDNNDSGKRKKPSSPRFIYRDEDIYVEISDESDSSDCDWRTTQKVNNKKSTTATPTKKNSGSKRKVKVRPSADDRMPPKSERVTRASNGSVEKVEGAGPAPAVVVAVKAETSRKGKGATGGGRKGKNGAEWGKLDLNVEFNNDVEDSATAAAAAAAAAAGRGSGAGSGGGEEDNIEGISFFEGLDEFLSSLPILNVVGGDDKVKAT